MKTYWSPMCTGVPAFRGQKSKSRLSPSLSCASWGHRALPSCSGVRGRPTARGKRVGTAVEGF